MRKEKSFWKGFLGLFILLIFVGGCAGQTHPTSQEKKEVKERADRSQKALEQEETKKE